MFSNLRRDRRHPPGPGSAHGRTLMLALIIATLLAGGSAAQAMEVTGRLDVRSVVAQRLYQWIVKYSDGKADEALVRRWINIERSARAANFFHPEVATVRSASVFFFDGSEGKRPLGCERLSTNALDRGVITDTRRVSSPCIAPGFLDSQ